MTAKKEWFESWFDTNYYHTLYCNRDEQEAEDFISKLCQTLSLEEGAKALDFACGKGRHSYFLHQQGLDVLGVDLSENSIQQAQKMARQGLRFAVSDIRKVIEGEKFDAIFNLFTSFGYFNDLSDNLKVMNAIREMLLPGGTFVIDFFNANYVINHLIKEDTIQRGDLTFRITKSYRDGLIIKTIDFVDKEKPFHFEERVQAITLNDFKNLVEQSGMSIQNTYGSYELDPFDPEHSKRLIIVGTR